MLDQIFTEYDLDFLHFSRDPVYRKILVLADLHIPFDRYDVIKWIIDNEEADILVLNGDILDLFSLAYFMKERDIHIKEEIDRGLDLIDILSKKFKTVIMTRGNHEYRFNRYLAGQLDPSVYNLFQTEILAFMAKGGYQDNDTFHQRYHWNNVSFPGGKEPFWVQIGGTVIIHPMEFSKIPMRTSTGIVGPWAIDRGINFDLCITGHTHQWGSIVDGGRMYWEPGCLCWPLDYEKQGKCKYKVQKLGYAVVAQDKKGRFVFNESRNVYLGCHRVRKEVI